MRGNIIMKKDFLKIKLGLITLIILVAQLIVTAHAATYLDPLLVNFYNSRQEMAYTRVIALMKYETQGLVTPRRYENANVKKYLISMYQQSIRPLQLAASKNPNEIVIRQHFWINNSIALDVTPQGLKRIAALPSVEKIYANNKIVYMRPVAAKAAILKPRNNRTEAVTYPYDLIDIGIDKLMAVHPEIQGAGVNVGVIDTGADGNHPALKGKIALFYDSSVNKITEPVDRDQHGTHVSGTIAGGDRDTMNIGVAPQAKLYASAALGGYDAMLKTMQFMLDPDGNPNTNDAPRLISNSWNAGGAPDIELFYRAISAWEAAGILPVFSAGNAGPRPKTITTPHEHPSVIAVGATGKDAKVANFSSRGPGIFQGKEIQKPDFTAPGVDIVSSIPGGKMAAFSGTSMACPHAAGAAALLYQVNPKFTPQQVREILTRTLTFVDDSGKPIVDPKWNPAYGFGRMNVLAAVNAALGTLGRNQFRLTMNEFSFAPSNQMNLNPTNFSTADLTMRYPTDSSKWAILKQVK